MPGVEVLHSSIQVTAPTVKRLQTLFLHERRSVRGTFEGQAYRQIDSSNLELQTTSNKNEQDVTPVIWSERRVVGGTITVITDVDISECITRCKVSSGISSRSEGRARSYLSTLNNGVGLRRPIIYRTAGKLKNKFGTREKGNSVCQSLRPSATANVSCHAVLFTVHPAPR
ncbi:hypothetical protein J6590_011354 [Homalodisca vitripennis]|nr:hypothetical protein J6590_011354 [Homalodisca vitripennis]